jgi:hypothetical protein
MVFNLYRICLSHNLYADSRNLHFLKPMYRSTHTGVLLILNGSFVLVVANLLGEFTFFRYLFLSDFGLYQFLLFQELCILFKI